MRADGAELWEWVHVQRAHVYLCGATAMGRDVVGVLHSLAGTHGGMGEAEAASYVKTMTAEGRLVQELWS